jgi:hypothetical protein
MKDSANKVLPFPKPKALLFPVKSALFEALVDELDGNRVQARLVVKLEDLFKKFGALDFPTDYIKTFITHPTDKCLKNHFPDISERTLRTVVGSVRTGYDYKAGVSMPDDVLPAFQGKYYATRYNANKNRKVLKWWRNAPLLDTLYNRVQARIKPSKQHSFAGCEQPAIIAGDLQVICSSFAGDLQVVNSQQLTTNNEQQALKHKQKTENTGTSGNQKSPTYEPVGETNPKTKNAKATVVTKEKKEKEENTETKVNSGEPIDLPIYDMSLSEYSSPYDLYRYFYKDHAGYYPPHTAKLKKQVDRLRKTFDDVRGSGILGQCPPTFGAFLFILFSQWKRIYQDNFEDWKWMLPNDYFPDPKLFEKSGGEDLVKWYVKNYLAGTAYE